MLDIFVGDVSVDANRISYDLHNEGNQVAKGVFTEVWWSQDAVLDRSDRLLKNSKTSLDGGQIKEVNLLVDFPLNSGNILVKTDSRNRYVEMDENNNLSSTALTERSRSVDLTVVGSALYAQSDYLMVGHVVKNIGGESVDRFTKTIMFDGRALVDNSYSMNLFEQGWRQERTFWTYIQGSISVGRHVLTVTVDRGNQIAELNELNNSFSWQIEKLPDNTFKVQLL